MLFFVIIEIHSWQIIIFLDFINLSFERCTSKVALLVSGRNDIDIKWLRSFFKLHVAMPFIVSKGKCKVHCTCALKVIIWSFHDN